MLKIRTDRKEWAWRWHRVQQSLERLMDSAGGAQDFASSGKGDEYFSATEWYNGHKNDFFEELEHLNEIVKGLERDIELEETEGK